MLAVVPDEGPEEGELVLDAAQDVALLQTLGCAGLGVLMD